MWINSFIYCDLSRNFLDFQRYFNSWCPKGLEGSVFYLCHRFEVLLIPFLYFLLWWWTMEFQVYFYKSLIILFSWWRAAFVVVIYNYKMLTLNLSKGCFFLVCKFMLISNFHRNQYTLLPARHGSENKMVFQVFPTRFHEWDTLLLKFLPGFWEFSCVSFALHNKYVPNMHMQEFF